MKKKIAVLLTIIMMFAVISGCNLKSSSSSNKNIKILFSVSNLDSYRKSLAENAEDYAKSKNIELKVVDAGGSIEAQVSQMKEAASSGYNVILCAPVNPETALQLKKATKGIPIIFMNSSPDDDMLEKDKYIYVASNEMDAGRYEAEYIADYLKNKNDLKVVLFKGEKENSSATIGRTKAVKETFKKKGINAEYVFEDYANWSRQTAKDMFNVFLSTNRKFDCVICNNDEMAFGVIDALKEHKIDSSTVPIVGVDATAEGLKSVTDGSMKLTVYQSAKGQSKSAVDAAIKLGAGETLSNIENVAEDGKHIWVPFEKVDKDNVEKYK